MIVLAETPMLIPDSLTLKYVKKTVAVPAPTKAAPKTTLLITLRELFTLDDDAVCDALWDDVFRHSDGWGSLSRKNWLLTGMLLREPTTDTRERSVIDGWPQLDWIGWIP